MLIHQNFQDFVCSCPTDTSSQTRSESYPRQLIAIPSAKRCLDISARFYPRTLGQLDPFKQAITHKWDKFTI